MCDALQPNWLLVFNQNNPIHSNSNQTFSFLHRHCLHIIPQTTQMPEKKLIKKDYNFN